MEKILYLTNRAKRLRGGELSFSQAISDPPQTLNFGSATVALTADQAKVKGLADPEDTAITIDLAAPDATDASDTTGWQSTLNILRERMAAGRDQVFFIHGFDTHFEDALWYTAQLQLQLNKALEGDRARPENVGLRFPDGIDLIAYSWPANRSGILRKPAAAVGYFADLRDSAASTLATSRFLEFLAALHETPADSGTGRIHLICQSMGVRVLDLGFRHFRHDREPASLPRLADSISLSGSDVGSHAFEKAKHLKHLPDVCRKVTVYHNRRDKLGGLSMLLRLFWGPGERKRLSKHGLLNPAATPSVDGIDVGPAVEALKVSAPEIEDPLGHYYARLNPAVLSDNVTVMAGADWATKPSSLRHRDPSTPANQFNLNL